MFARVSSRSYSCLQCQHRLALRSSSSSGPHTLIQPLHRRWQSATAAALQGEEEEDEKPPAIHYENTEPNTKYRHWRPAPTAQLGVSVLGEPAEILVLPQGGKKRRNDEKRGGGEPADNEPSSVGDKPSLSVREVLAQESRAASPTEALEHIERLKEELSREADPGSNSWVTYHDALHQGFTATQLRRYAEAKTSQTLPPMVKRALAAFIMTKIWKYKHDLPEQRITRTILVGEPQAALMSMTGIYPKNPSVPQGLSIQLGSNKSSLTMEGKPSEIRRAAIYLQQNLKSSFVTRMIELPTEVHTLLRSKQVDFGRTTHFETRHPVLYSLLQEHGVVLRPGRESGIRSYCCATAFSVDHITNLEHDLIVNYSRANEASNGLPLSIESLNATASMPMFLSGQSLVTSAWYRHVSADQVKELPLIETVDETTDRLDALAGELLQKVQNAAVSTADYIYSKQNHSARRGLVYQYTADVGQAIYQKLNLQDEFPFNGDFVTQIPLLPQFLSQLQPLKPGNTKSNAVDQHDRLLWLYFKSAGPQQPSLEIYATSSTSSGLKIKSVGLVIDDASQAFALPRAVIDLNITRRLIMQLFSDGEPLVQEYAPFMAQLAGQLMLSEDARTKNVKIPLNNMMTLDFKSLPLAKDSVIMAPNAANALSEPRGRSAKTEKLKRYALISAEWVDKAVYHAPIDTHNPLFIEHLIFTPLPQSPVQQSRQTVRLVETPLLQNVKQREKHESKPSKTNEEVSTATMVDSNPETFKQFIKNSYKAIIAYDRFVREQTRRMVAERRS